MTRLSSFHSTPLLRYVDKIDLEEMLVQRDPEKQLEMVIGGEEGFGGAHSWRVTLR